MTYELKGGEGVKDGKLYGWLGKPCEYCGGSGESGADHPRACTGCGGTGEAHGLMPVQPADLPPETD